jgi:hypothetical protein
VSDNQASLDDHPERRAGQQVVREVVEVQVIDTTVEITLLVLQITGVGFFVVIPLEFKHGVSMFNVEGFVPPKSVHSHSAGDKSHCCQLQLGDGEALPNSRNALDNEPAGLDDGKYLRNGV